MSNPVDPLTVATLPGEADAKGFLFDPTKHAKYPTGRGMKTKEGCWFRKGGKPPSKVGTPVKSAAAQRAEPSPAPKGGDPLTEPFKGWELPPANPAPVADATTAPTEPPPANTPTASTVGTVAGDAVGGDGLPLPPAAAPNPTACDAKARAIVTAIEATGRMILGPDMEHSTEERSELSAAWRLYFETSGGGPEVPPWAGVALGYFGLIARRTERETFRSRCAAIWGKLSGA